MSSISSEDDAYQSLRTVLQEEFGVVIGEERKHSITAKLMPVMAEFSLDSLGALAGEMRNKDAVDLRNSVLHAITTFEHEWFEPRELFNLLDDYLLDEMLDRGRERYRIWVIGSGAGQLPYSLAMKIREALKTSKSATQVTIEATDVSNAVVNAAARGVFEQRSMDGITDDYRNKYMESSQGRWQVANDIRSMVVFSSCNLHDDFEGKGHFDLIICLDVLVYFSVPVKTKLLESFAKLLDPSGILIAGMNEPVLPFNSSFDMVRHEDGIFYRQKPD